MYKIDHRDRFYRDEIDEFILITTEIEVESEPEESDNQENLSESPATQIVEIELSDDDIVDDSFEIYESITDADSLTFQNCRSSYISFTTKYCEYSLYNQWLEVKKVLVIDRENDVYEEVPIGYFYVWECNLSRDGITQEIVAYDALYTVINSNAEIATNIYNSISFPLSIKDFRDNFFYLFGIEQENISLINDDIVIPRQISEEDYITGETVVQMISEINGVFPHIGKDGLLHWKSLDVGDIHEVGLYPGFYPSEHSYPGGGYTGEYIDIYKEQYIENSVIWANYAAQKPDGVQIRDENNNIVYFANSENSVNPYTVINNFLCYGLSFGQYQQIAERLYRKIKDIIYIPFEMTKMADPCLEVGDRICIHTQENVEVISYIFNKTTSNIAHSIEDIQASGTYDLSQYDINTNTTAAKVKNLDNRVGNIEKSGSGPLQIVSVAALPDNPQLNVLYLIQGEVTVR